MMAAQASKLAFFPIWSYAHPTAIELADRLAAEAPGDLNKVFFSSGGGESVETAWKVAKQYFKLIGKPNKTKVISRSSPTTAPPRVPCPSPACPASSTRSSRWCRDLPGAEHQFYRGLLVRARREPVRLWAANRLEEMIIAEGPDSVAAIFAEPVQNAGGCFPPPPGYFERLREICDTYDVLLVSDEVICAYGRLGTMFGAQKYSYQPDIITTAKGLTLGYTPLGAAIISDRIFEPFGQGNAVFPRRIYLGGHPVSCAVALANLDIFEREDLLGNVLRNENALRQTLERLYDLPIVGDVRGDGYFYGIELVKDKADQGHLIRRSRNASSWRLPPAGWCSKRLCSRAGKQHALIIHGPATDLRSGRFDEWNVLRHVLTEAWAKI